MLCAIGACSARTAAKRRPGVLKPALCRPNAVQRSVRHTANSYKRRASSQTTFRICEEALLFPIQHFLYIRNEVQPITALSLHSIIIRLHHSKSLWQCQGNLRYICNQKQQDDHNSNPGPYLLDQPVKRYLTHLTGHEQVCTEGRSNESD